MAEKNWFASRREEVGLSQDDVVALLQKAGLSYSRTTISGWENNRHFPPIENPLFRKTLAQIFRLSEKRLVEIAFLLDRINEDSSPNTDTEQHSRERREDIQRAIFILENMDDQIREMALRLLESMVDPYVRHGIKPRTTKK